MASVSILPEIIGLHPARIEESGVIEIPRLSP
jgi:hypothetical protein